MEWAVILWLEGIAVLLVVSSLTFLCLKIKSSKKNPEFLGVAGTLVHKNPDEDQGTRQLPAPPPPPPASSIPQDSQKVEEELDDEEEEENNNLKEGGIREEHLYSKVTSLDPSSESVSSTASVSNHPKTPPSSSSYAKIRTASSEHPYAQLESRPKREHEYATLQESLKEEHDVPDGKAAATYMTLSEANSEETYAAIGDPLGGGTYAMIHDEVKRPPVDESGYTLVNKSKKKETKQLYAQVNKPSSPSSVDESGYSRVDKTSKRPPSSADMLEDMYAKVHKKYESENEENSPPPPPRPPSRPKSRGDEESLMRPQRVGPVFQDPMEEDDENSDGYEILREKRDIDLSRKDSANYEILPDVVRSNIHLRRQDSSVGYETVPLEMDETSWNHSDYDDNRRYETVTQKYFPSDCSNHSDSRGHVRQEPLGKSDPPYAELMKEDEEEGYETIPRMNTSPNDSINTNTNDNLPTVKKELEYDPAYEVVTKALSEPAYETIESKSHIATFDGEVGYDDTEGAPSSLIYMSVQESNHSSPDSNRRASVVVIERVDVPENIVVNNENNSINEIDTHIFV